jgi:transposase-like protein
MTATTAGGDPPAPPPERTDPGGTPPFTLDLAPPGTLTPRLIRRFWSRFARPETDCWDWSGALNPKGYGEFGVGDRSPLAHRFAFELFVGPIPRGRLVCHRCDNPRCVNPAHLFIGTHADNVHDMMAKGRRPVPWREKKIIIQNLTDEQVAEIRRRGEGGGESLSAIARELGVTTGLVSRLVHGRRRHISPRSLILSDEDKQAVCERYAQGDISYGQLATAYGVTVRYISYVLKQWTATVPAGRGGATP